MAIEHTLAQPFVGERETLNAPTGEYAAAFGAVRAAPAVGSAAVNVTAPGGGLYYGLFGAGSGMVLGQVDEYTNCTQAAKSPSAATPLKCVGTYNFFVNLGQCWTLIASFLQGSVDQTN